MPTERAEYETARMLFRTAGFPGRPLGIISLKKADHKHRDPVGRLAENARKRRSRSTPCSRSTTSISTGARRGRQTREAGFSDLPRFNSDCPPQVKMEATQSQVHQSLPAIVARRLAASMYGSSRHTLFHRLGTPKPFLRYRQDYG